MWGGGEFTSCQIITLKDLPKGIVNKPYFSHVHHSFRGNIRGWERRKPIRLTRLLKHKHCLRRGVDRQWTGPLHRTMASAGHTVTSSWICKPKILWKDNRPGVVKRRQVINAGTLATLQSLELYQKANLLVCQISSGKGQLPRFWKGGSKAFHFRNSSCFKCICPYR